MLIAMEHIGSVGVGVTAPQFFRADDEKIYVVKLQNNRLGSKVLVSEFLAAKIGERMGLCFPNSDIILINEQMLQNSPCLIKPMIGFGRHFASQYLENTEYVGEKKLYQAINIAEMAGVLLFDHMFHNADRANNRKNLLIRQENAGYKIYAIDNSHLFRSGKWTLDSLNNLSTKFKPYYRHFNGLLLRDCLSSQDFQPYLEKIAAISNHDIETIVAEIPNEWLPDKPERQALTHFIKIRRDMAEDIKDTLCKYIPISRGGSRWLYGNRIRSHHQNHSVKR